MIKRVFSAIDSVTGVPRRIIFGGLLPALLLMLASACVLLKPQISYDTFILSRQMCKTAMTLFSEGIILGLFLDAILKRT